ncbi:hypothetical protein SK128_025380 [Halocaridina rubra]|uniref:Uncharacterized protein n=1 Tax=Halocaridina rubra TaxID=373956 RepID=A0AAN9ABN3_HALRR
MLLLSKSTSCANTNVALNLLCLTAKNQDLAVSADGSDLLDIIDQNVPGYHRVTKTDPFQDPTMEDEPFCCLHKHHILTSISGGGGPFESMTSTESEMASLDFSPFINEDFQRMYSDWQQHLDSLQVDK